MIADFGSDHTLYEACLTLLDSCFPGIKSIADQGRNHNAFWDRCSIPFIVRDGQALIAHLGLWPFDFIIQGKPFKGAAIHGVCTKEEFRNRGYFKELMQEALKYSKQYYDFSLLFTDKPYLYTKYGFKVLEEYDFVYFPSSQISKSKIRKMNLDFPEDLKLMQNLYYNRVPISNCFGILKETTIATLNAMHEPIYYIDSMNVMIIYQIKEDVLYLKDLIATAKCELDLVLNAIPEKFSKVILQFSPDNFLIPPFQATVATPECCIMISEDFDMKCVSFRYPEPQRC